MTWRGNRRISYLLLELGELHELLRFNSLRSLPERTTTGCYRASKLLGSYGSRSQQRTADRIRSPPALNWQDGFVKFQASTPYEHTLARPHTLAPYACFKPRPHTLASTPYACAPYACHTLAVKSRLFQMKGYEERIVDDSRDFQTHVLLENRDSGPYPVAIDPVDRPIVIALLGKGLLHLGGDIEP